MAFPPAAAGRVPAARVLLALAACAAGIHIALTAQGSGDYGGDAAPAIDALLHFDLHAFGAATPAMGDLSLFLRAPFAALAYLGSPTQLEIYRWGAVPCVLSVALLGLWLASIARSHGTGLLGQTAIVALALANPLVRSALQDGHPEELLTASLAIGAVVAAAERRVLLSTVLLGLAIASKQWAVIACFPVLAALPRRRGPLLAGAAAIVAIVSLPAFVLSPARLLHDQFVLVHQPPLSPASYSWLFLIAPRVTRQLGGGLIYQGPALPAALGGLLHPLIIVSAMAVAGYLAWRARGPLTVDALFAAVALIFLLRCTLDTETMPYYHAPLLLALLAWDALHGERLPYRGILGAALAYGCFDRLTPTVVGVDASSASYLAASLAAVVLLAIALERALLGGTARAALPRVPSSLQQKLHA